MNIGLSEIVIILVVILVLFGVFWAVKAKRSSARPSNIDAATQDKAKK